MVNIETNDKTQVDGIILPPCHITSGQTLEIDFREKMTVNLSILLTFEADYPLPSALFFTACFIPLLSALYFTVCFS
jgi:hypothetical protein